MKAFTKENFIEFIKSESNSGRAEYYETPQARVQDVYDRFIQWCREEDKLALPVYVCPKNKLVVRDSAGKRIASTTTYELARAMVKQLNEMHELSKSRIKANRVSEDPDEDDEDWSLIEKPVNKPCRCKRPCKCLNSEQAQRIAAKSKTGPVKKSKPEEMTHFPSTAKTKRASK